MSKIQPFTFANFSLLNFNGQHHSALAGGEEEIKEEGERLGAEGVAGSRPGGGRPQSEGQGQGGALQQDPQHLQGVNWNPAQEEETEEGEEKGVYP